jgi:ATP-binding cassette subfamily F protein uup
MLAVRGLKLAYGAHAVLDDASLVVDDADRVALVGDNGAGKSTFLKVVAGAVKADDGLVERGRGQTLALLSQEPQLDVDKSAREILGATGREPWEIDEALGRLGVTDADKPVRALSGGQRRRVDLAKTLLFAADILLLDEPTNHLDTSAIAWLAERVRAHRGPVVVVSHDRAFLDETCTRVVELARGKLFSYAPPADKTTTLTHSFVEQKLVRDDIAVKTQHKKERLWLRELAWLRAGTPARTTKQQARIDRAASLEEWVENEAQALREQKKVVGIEGVASKRLGKTILSFEDLALARGDRVLFTGLTLTVTRGQRWGVVGDNGAGKTTLLQAILTACGHKDAAADPVLPEHGRLVVGDNTHVVVFDQHRRSLDPEATLEGTLAAQNDHVFVPGDGGGRVHVSSYLERFLFDGSDRARRVKTLSGGEQNRLVLAKLFLGDANVLLLDEPTNDLDVTTLGVLEEALLNHPGCAFLVSHDRRFLDRVATGILAFEKPSADQPATVTPVLGDWTHYVRTQSERLKTQQTKGASASASAAASAAAAAAASAAAAAAASAAASAAAAASSAAAAAAKPVAKRKRSYKEEQEFQAMETTILARESRREDVRALLLDGSLFKSDGAKAAKLTEELHGLDQEIERLYARWAELSEWQSM